MKVKENVFMIVTVFPTLKKYTLTKEVHAFIFLELTAGH
jgi:hypothetical protein